MIVLIAVICLFLIVKPAMATEVCAQDTLIQHIELDSIDELVDAWSFPEVRELVEKLLRGEFSVDSQSVKSILTDFFVAASETARDNVSALLAPVMMSILAGIISEKKQNHYEGIQIFCRISAACVISQMYFEARKYTVLLIEDIVALCGTISPVITSVLSLTGAVKTASLLSPLSSLAAYGISSIISNIGLTLTGASAAVAVVGNLSCKFRLKRLFKLLQNGLIWMTGLMIAGFTGLLSIQGLMGNSLDSVAVRGMQYTAETLIPIIGGNVSDSMGSVLTSAAAVRNAVGISGILLLVMRCLKPLTSLVTFCMTMKVSAAIMEPSADECITDTTSQFGDVAKMLLVICVGSMLMVMLLVGAGILASSNLTS